MTLRVSDWYTKSRWTEFLGASLLAWTCDIILSLSAGSSVLYHFAQPDKSFSFSSGFNDLYRSALFLFLCRIERVKPFCSLLFLCSIQWFIPNCSARQKSLFFCRTKWFIPFCWLDKSFSFPSGPSDLYHSALLDKSVFSSARSSDFYQYIALLYTQQNIAFLIGQWWMHK